MPGNSPVMLPMCYVPSQDMLEGMSAEEIAELPPFPFPKELFPPGKHLCHHLHCVKCYLLCSDHSSGSSGPDAACKPLPIICTASSLPACWHMGKLAVHARTQLPGV